MRPIDIASSFIGTAGRYLTAAPIAKLLYPIQRNGVRFLKSWIEAPYPKPEIFKEHHSKWATLFTFPDNGKGPISAMTTAVRIGSVVDMCMQQLLNQSSYFKDKSNVKICIRVFVGGQCMIFAYMKLASEIAPICEANNPGNCPEYISIPDTDTSGFYAAAAFLASQTIGVVFKSVVQGLLSAAARPHQA